MATCVPDTSEKTQPPPYEELQQDYSSATHDVTTATVVDQPAAMSVIVTSAFGPLPANVTCPHCRSQIVTSITYQPGVLSWLCCAGLALCGCWYGCCLIPFCVDGMKDCRHSCPRCSSFLGVYRRI